MARNERARIISAIARMTNRSEEDARTWLRGLDLPPEAATDKRLRTDLARRSAPEGDDTIKIVEARGRV